MANKLDNKVVSETVDVAAMKKQLDDVCSKVRRMSDNWKKFAGKFIGKTDDGKLSGNVRVALAVFALAMIATATYAASTIWQGYNGDAVKGTCKFVSDDAGATTLTVDKVVAASGVTAPITGDMTGDDINANGTAAASLDINYTATATGTLATISAKVVKTAASMTDNDAVVFDLFNGNNDSGEKVSYAKMTATATDVTTNTEDATLKFTIPVAGVDTDVATLGGAAGVTLPLLTVSGAITASGGVNGALNGAVGGTTPAAGRFTTLNASSTCVVTGALTCASVDTGTGEATVDGKYAVTGGDASTGLMIQKGTFTNGQAAVTFGAVFGGAPSVVCGWTDDPSALTGTNAAVAATSITVSNFVPKSAITSASLTNCNYIAVGTRP